MSLSHKDKILRTLKPEFMSYVSIFETPNNIGNTTIVKRRINTDNSQPIRQTPRTNSSQITGISGISE